MPSNSPRDRRLFTLYSSRFLTSLLAAYMYRRHSPAWYSVSECSVLGMCRYGCSAVGVEMVGVEFMCAICGSGVLVHSVYCVGLVCGYSMCKCVSV